MSTARHQIGSSGEQIARWFLARHGISIIAGNVRVGRGEVDLVGRDGHAKLIVEVRSRVSEFAPVDAFDAAKQHQLRRLSGELGIGRVDLVAVGFGTRFVSVHWIPFAI